MGRKPILYAILVLCFLLVGWLVSGAIGTAEPEEFQRPAGTTGERIRTDPEKRMLLRTSQRTWAASQDGGFTFAQYVTSGEAAEATTSVWHSTAGSLVLTDPTGVWLSVDPSRDLRKLDTSVANENSVITCGAAAGDRVLFGTTFEGLWLSDDGGETWDNFTENEAFDFMYRGAGFYEQVAFCSLHESRGEVTFALDFGNGYYRVTDDGVRQLYLVERASLSYLNEAYERHIPIVKEARTTGPNASDAGPASAAQDRHGIYLSAGSAARANLADYLELLSTNRFDSIVVDFKDDLGRLTYDTSLERPRTIGAVNPVFNVEELLAAAHSAGLYVIARVVVFKDEKLFGADGYRHAVWNGVSNRPWGRFVKRENAETGEIRWDQVEHWVDPYSEEVWQYNIDIALELEALGVDEIQFDYIRFPSDGPTEQAIYRYQGESSDRVDALTGFLSSARNQISIPIGIDVFGFNAWFRTRYLGQDIAALSPYVDVISPMNYPSHFSRTFLPELTYFQRARHIYDHGSERAQAIVGPSTIIRPYVQAFLIGPELAYEEEEYSTYLIEQLEGTLDSSADGFTLWNASGRYYMVTDAVTKTIAPRLRESQR